MGYKNYKELLVWQKSMDLVEIVYKLVKYLPKEETYALSDQMRRAVISIPSNIAEGHQRNSPRDFKYFLGVARGSNAELETQLLVCIRLNYLTQQQTEQALIFTEEIGKMLSAFITTLSNQL